jgi:hypothetical protein
VQVIVVEVLLKMSAESVAVMVLQMAHVTVMAM